MYMSVVMEHCSKGHDDNEIYALYMGKCMCSVRRNAEC